jgi:predicted aspartyl protease
MSLGCGNAIKQSPGGIMKTVAAIGVGAVLVLFSANSYAFTALVVPQDTQSVTIHFKLLDDYAILVPAKLGNGRSIKAMIDTGSVETMVDSSLAKQLKLKSQEDVQIVLSEGRLVGKRVTVDHIEIGNLAFANQSMLAADLGRFSADLHTPIDMIIGYNMLCSLSSFQIDYAAKVLSFVRVASANKNNRCDDHSLPIVNAIIAGQKHLRLLVDTGSKGLMLFGEGREYGAPNIDVTGGTRLNTQPGLNVRRVQLPNIDFGRGTVVKHPRAYLIEPRPSNLTWIDGFLGGGGEIGLSSLRIDMHEQTVRLRFRGQP